MEKHAEKLDSRNIHQRIAAAMAAVTYVQKDHKIQMGGSGGYKVVTHDAVTAKVRPELLKHGVIYYPQNLHVKQDGNRTEVFLDVHFVNVANPADFIDVPTFGYGIDPGDKGPGKAVSYAVKYALLKALGLETGEDADTDGGAEHKPEPKPAPGVAKAKEWIREHIRDLGNSADGADFISEIANVRTWWLKIAGVYPQLWVGPDGSGLRGEGRRLATILQAEVEYDAFVKEIEKQVSAKPKEAA